MKPKKELQVTGSGENSESFLREAKHESSNETPRKLEGN